MAAVSIRYGLTSADPLAETPKSQWPQLMEMRRLFCERRLPGDCRLLLQFIEDGRVGGFAGYDDEAAYIRDGLGLDPQAVRWAVEGLEIAGSEVPIPFADAVERGRRAAADVMADAEPLDTRKEAGEKGGRGNKASVNNTSFTRGSGNVDYLAARIKRDAPDIAAAVERGEYKSIRAAAKAAGIVRDKEPFEHLCRWWRKAPLEQQQQFRDFIDTPVMDERFR